MLDEHMVRRLIDEDAIRRQIHTYCRAVDRGDNALLRSIYHEDAEEAHGGYQGGVDGFIDYAAQIVAMAESSTHHVTTILIDVDGDTATSESWFISVSARMTWEGGEPIDLIITGRYLDRWRRDGSIWKISMRLVAFDTNHTFPSSQCWDGPLYESFRPRGRTDRSDPIYDLLTRRGD